jgi:hypothetical protein
MRLTLAAFFTVTKSTHPFSIYLLYSTVLVSLWMDKTSAHTAGHTDSELDRGVGANPPPPRGALARSSGSKSGSMRPEMRPRAQIAEQIFNPDPLTDAEPDQPARVQGPGGGGGGFPNDFRVRHRTHCLTPGF